MKFRKRILLLALFPLLISCSSGNSDDRITISFFGWGSTEEQSNFQELVNQFMRENEDIKVIYDAVDSTQYMNALKNKVRSLPDVFYMPDYEFFSWADAGKLLDLSSYLSEEELNSVWKKGIDIYRYDVENYALGEGDAIYGLPKDLGPYSLVVNLDMLDSALSKAEADGHPIARPSFSTPMTFTEFTNFLVELKPYLVTNANPNGYGIGYYELQHAVWSNNADFFTEDAKTSLIDQQNFIDAVQWTADLNLKHHVMATAAENDSQNGYIRFFNKGCLFTFMGPWDMKAFWEYPFEWDIFPTPCGDASGSTSTSWLGSVAYSIRSSFTKNESLEKEASIKLAKWLTFSQNSNTMNYQLGQAMPNVVSMAENDFVNNVGLEGTHTMPSNKQLWIDMTKQTATIKARTRATYYLYNYQCYNDLLTALKPIYEGKKTAEELCTTYNSTFQKGLDDSWADLK